MASVELVIEADRDAVWAVICDPRTYPAWLVGAKSIRAVDEDWPAPGTAFHHRVGFGPITFDDHTTVVEAEPGRLLKLRIRATLLLQAIARFELREGHRGTHVSFEEEPAHRIIGNLVRPVMDPLTHVRNLASLRRLDDFLAAPARG
jgi:uncharacterized protein YndB with AHSA1/START domain